MSEKCRECEGTGFAKDRVLKCSVCNGTGIEPEVRIQTAPDAEKVLKDLRKKYPPEVKLIASVIWARDIFAKYQFRLPLSQIDLIMENARAYGEQEQRKKDAGICRRFAGELYNRRVSLEKAGGRDNLVISGSIGEIIEETLEAATAIEKEEENGNQNPHNVV